MLVFTEYEGHPGDPGARDHAKSIPKTGRQPILSPAAVILELSRRLDHPLNLTLREQWQYAILLLGNAVRLVM